MIKGRKKFIIIGIIGLIILVGAVIFVRSRYGIALLKSKAHFKTSLIDQRVRYEPGAEEFAEKIARFLPEAVRTVEKGHLLPFKKPFIVYVCSTQKSCNEFIATPPGTAPRGAAAMGDVYIAPSAFSFFGYDTHKESLMHELSHLHLWQRLGFFGIKRKIPVWFSEGLANDIAGSGGEGIGEREAIDAILAGRHFLLEEKGALLRAFHKAFPGISGRMFHKQNKMFVKYIKDTHPDNYKRFLLEIQQGESFGKSFSANFGANVSEMFERFKKRGRCV
jgi:hypothetical protein